jgi:hypothetical protein
MTLLAPKIDYHIEQTVSLYSLPISYSVPFSEQRLVYEVGALPTKVVCLTHVISPDDLRDDEEYSDILEDMTLEARKYGKPHVTKVLNSVQSVLCDLPFCSFTERVLFCVFSFCFVVPHSTIAEPFIIRPHAKLAIGPNLQRTLIFIFSIGFDFVTNLMFFLCFRVCMF